MQHGQHERIWTRAPGPYFVHIGDDTVHDLALERLEDNCTIACDELGLATAAEHHTLSDVKDGDDCDDVAELSRASSLDIGVELRLEELQHPRPKVGWVQ
jgi:hypothetical protein